MVYQLERWLPRYLGWEKRVEILPVVRERTTDNALIVEIEPALETA